jgi:hypothetical protein
MDVQAPPPFLAAATTLPMSPSDLATVSSAAPSRMLSSVAPFDCRVKA